MSFFTAACMGGRVARRGARQKLQLEAHAAAARPPRRASFFRLYQGLVAGNQGIFFSL